DLLGEWAHNELASKTSDQQRAQSYMLLEFFRARGVVRDDRDVREQAYMLDAIVVGFLLIDQYIPGYFKYFDEEVAEMAAEAARRTFEPSRPSGAQPDEKTKKEIANSFISTLDNILALMSGMGQQEDQL